MIGNIHNQDELDTMDSFVPFTLDPSENDLDDLSWLNGIDLDSTDEDFDSVFFVGSTEEDSDDLDWLFGSTSYSTEADWDRWNYIPSVLDWLCN